MPFVSHLLIKPAHKQALQHVETITVDPVQGIQRQVKSPPLRQVLILEQATLDEFDLQPGDLRENMIVRDFNLYGLPSGTVIQIGGVKVALTFPCEPCKVIADKVNLKAIRHERGYLGRFLNSGVIHVSDNLAITDQTVEAVPDIPVERIKWHLAKIEQPILAADLMWQVGLASSYCRALPAMLRKHPEIDENKIIFQRQLL